MDGVSVVIPHYGDPQPTLALVARLLPQLQDEHEIIVADDHSPSPFPTTPGITVVRRERNGGFGSACNAGAAVATKEFLLFLNSDLDVSPTFLDDMVTGADPWQPCVAGPRIIENGAIDPSARHFPTVRHQVVEWLTPLARWRHTRLLHESVGHDMNASMAEHVSVTDWLVGAALLIRRSDFKAVGGFDESFYMNSEEVDLQRRLRDQGVPAVYLPGVIVTHEGGGSSESTSRRRWLVESRWRYAEKWDGTLPLAIGLTAATATNLVWNATRRALGRDSRPLATAREEIRLIRGRRM